MPCHAVISRMSSSCLQTILVETDNEEDLPITQEVCVAALSVVRSTALVPVQTRMPTRIVYSVLTRH